MPGSEYGVQVGGVHWLALGGWMTCGSMLRALLGVQVGGVQVGGLLGIEGGGVRALCGSMACGSMLSMLLGVQVGGIEVGGYRQAGTGVVGKSPRRPVLLDCL